MSGSLKSSTVICGFVLLSLSLNAGEVALPGKITDLKVEQVSSTSIKLSWTAPEANGSNDRVSGYEVRSARNRITATTWPNATQISGAPAPAAAEVLQSMTITNLVAGQRYWFAVKTVDDRNSSRLSASIANKPQDWSQVDVWQMCGDALNARNRRLMEAIQPDFIGRAAFEYVGTVFMGRAFESCPSLDALKNRGAWLGCGYAYLHYTPFESMGPDVDRRRLGDVDDTRTWGPDRWALGEMKYFDFATDNPEKQMIWKGKMLIDLGFDAIEFDLAAMNDSHQQNVYSQLKEYAAGLGREVYITGNGDNIPGESPWNNVAKFIHADFALRQYPRNWKSAENYIPYYRGNVIRDGASKPSVAFVDCGPIGLVVPADKDRWPAFYRINEAELLAAGILPGSTYLYGDYIGLNNYVIEMNLSKFIRENRELFHDLSYITPSTLTTSVHKIYTSALGQKGRTLLHLVNGNYSYEDNQMAVQYDITVNMSVSPAPTAIWLTTPDELSDKRKQTLEYAYTNGVATINVPKLEYHDLIIFEQGATYNPVYSPMEILFPFPLRRCIPVKNQLAVYALQTEGHSSQFDWYVNQVPGGNTIYGTVASNGVYTAPSEVPDGGRITIRAVSQEDGGISSEFDITVVEAQALPWQEHFASDKEGRIPANWDIVGGLGDWKVTRDEADVVLHECNLGEYMEPGLITGGDQTWRCDYDFTCNAKVVTRPVIGYGMPSCMGGTYYQLLFGYTSPSNYFAYRICCDNKARLCQTLNGICKQIGEAVDCVFPEVGRYCEVKVSVGKGKSALSLGGALIRADDVAPDRGGIGFGTTLIEVYFKNISVSSPASHDESSEGK